MSGRFMVYGAGGFSGRIVVELAARNGLQPVLAARDDGAVRSLAGRFGLEHEVLSVDEPRRLAAALAEVDLVLNTAGPFAATARPLAEACMLASTHYLDITGEVAVLADLSRAGAQATASGVMLMPAVGFVVVPSDCLGAHVARRLPAARRLAIGISRTDLVSRGSAKTLLAAWSDSIAIRRGGRLAAVPAGTLERCFDYGRGPSGSAAVSWGDVVTAHHTTGVADVETYLEVSPSERAMFRFQRSVPAALRSAPVRRLLELQTKLLPEGPDVRRRAAARRVIVAEASDSAGRCARARLTTPEAYSFTAASALAVVERVLGGDFRPGFQTPALVYGPDFVLGIEGVVREDTA